MTSENTSNANFDIFGIELLNRLPRMKLKQRPNRGIPAPGSPASVVGTTSGTRTTSANTKKSITLLSSDESEPETGSSVKQDMGKTTTQVGKTITSSHKPNTSIKARQKPNTKKTLLANSIRTAVKIKKVANTTASSSDASHPETSSSRKKKKSQPSNVTHRKSAQSELETSSSAKSEKSPSTNVTKSQNATGSDSEMSDSDDHTAGTKVTKRKNATGSDSEMSESDDNTAGTSSTLNKGEKRTIIKKRKILSSSDSDEIDLDDHDAGTSSTRKKNIKSNHEKADSMHPPSVAKRTLFKPKTANLLASPKKATFNGLPPFEHKVTRKTHHI